MSARYCKASEIEILHTTLRFLPAIGGVESYVESLATCAARQGYGVTVATTTHGAEDAPRHRSEATLRIVRHPLLTGRTTGRYPVAPRFVLTVATSPADLVHAHGQHQFTTDVAIAAGRLRRTPVVVSPHYHPPRSRLGRMHERTVGRLLDAADAVATVSSFEERMLRRAGFHLRPMHRIAPAARDLPEPDTTFWGRLGLDPGTAPIICFVGRPAPHKRLDLLVEAITHVRRTVPETQLVVAGMSVAEYHQAVPVRCHPPAVVAGRISDPELTALYQGAAAVVLPSEYEAFGITVLEAMTQGAVPVAAAAGALPEVLDHNEELLFSPSSSRRLSEILTALVSDSALREELGSWSRSRAATEYSPERQAAQLKECYASALGRRRRARR